MILTDKEIRTFAENDNMIDPFQEENLQSESYDVTIGNKVVVMGRNIRCIDIDDAQAIDSMYEEMDIGEEGYIISPKQYVLISLGEVINIPAGITAHLRPKTRYTRLGLIVAGQHCNSTYCGRLRIGLFNATECPIRIKKGLPIAQLVFEELKSMPSDHKLYKNKQGAQYQNEGEKFIGSKFDPEFINKLIQKMA